MSWLAVVIILVLASGAAYWLWSHRSGEVESPDDQRPPSAPFAAVEIRLEDPCEAARALKGQRFLATEAPPLPLDACSAQRCSCSFAKMRDRRTSDRRVDLETMIAWVFSSDNRRDKNRDRRRE